MSLLDEAKKSVPPQFKVSDETCELAVAYFNGEISLKGVRGALKTTGKDWTATWYWLLKTIMEGRKRGFIAVTLNKKRR